MDYVINAIDKNKEVTVYVANTTDMVNKMVEIHKPSPVVSAAIGRSMTATSILGIGLKNKKDKITTIIKGNGEIGNITCVSNFSGNVKACAINYNVDIPIRNDRKLDVGRAVGSEGYITVIKDLGLKEPYVGTSKLVNGEIAEDYNNYLLTSEQIFSSVGLGVLVDVDHSIKHAGGFIISLMPFAKENTISTLEKNISKIDSVTNMMKDGKSPEDIANILLDGLGCDILAKKEVKYYCDCNRQRIEEALLLVGKKELEDMYNTDKNIEVQCHFCNTKYNFNECDITYLIGILN